MEESRSISSRRKFIRLLGGTMLAAGSGIIPTEILAAKSLRKLTILHTNDTHSRIDPFPDNDPRYAGLGGVARRAALIRRIRNEESNVLLFDSGDIFQGTPWFNLFGGRPEIESMSSMKYDAATMGNHDFDIGLEGFDRNLQYADFPFLCANYDFSNTLLAGKTLPYKIFEQDKIRIGVFGIGIELRGLVDEKLYGKTICNNAIDTALTISKKLKTELKCDYVICLSHLGYRYENQELISDEKLAAASKHIDLILGGHTHTFLDQPARLRNAEYNEILIAQAGFGGIKLGRIDIYFNEKTKKVFSNSSHEKIS